MTTSRYCVVGAGAAGLAAVQVLTRQGFAVDCFERRDRVGGHWHTDYESLHLITSRDVSGFEGHPMPPEFPVYPSRDQMRAYIESFADRFDLRRHVTFGTEVTGMEPEGPAGEQGWWVTTSDGRRTRYDGVLVANGHLWDPNLPEIATDFTGLSLHSSQYRDVDDVKGDRVLVVGAGNSGCDLAVDAANARLTTAISVRRGQVFQPKAIFGRPRAELRWLSKLPPVLQERVTRALVRVVVGPPEVYRGLPVPETRNLNDQPPVVNNLLLYWIQHGRIDVVPALERIDGQVVHFSRRQRAGVRHDPLGHRLPGSAAVPRPGAAALAGRGPAARGGPDGPRRAAASLLHRAGRPARPAAAGLLPAGPPRSAVASTHRSPRVARRRLRPAGPRPAHRHRPAGVERPDERDRTAGRHPREELREGELT